jgi:predicted dienelactone hydrolase
MPAWRYAPAAAALCVAATLAEAAGLRSIEVPAAPEGPALTGAVWSPCAAPAQKVMLRSVAVPGVQDCPITGDALPLVVISHGRRGRFGGHHDTAETLADGGFIVAAINHPGDNASDTSRTDDLSVLSERPADIKRLVDFMLGAWPDASRIDRERVVFFGFSRGGYTGLVAIGGNPDFRQFTALCSEGWTSRLCEQIRNNEIPAAPLTHDPRIKAAVLADPGFSFLFLPDDLKDLTVPVQLWGSALGGDGVSLHKVAAVDRTLAAKPDYHVVPNAGHFAFLAPCSAGQTNARPEPCVDAPDFDRVAFHKAFDADVLAFFRQHPGEIAKP